MAGLDSQGIVLQWENGGTPVNMPNVSSISWTGVTADTLDTTALDSTGGYRSFITSFKNPGTLSATVNFDPSLAAHQDAVGGVWNLFQNNTADTWRIIFPDGTIQVAFNAFVGTAPSVDASVGGLITSTMELTIDGPPTWTYV